MSINYGVHTLIVLSCEHVTMVSSFGETLTALIDLACAEVVWRDDLI